MIQRHFKWQTAAALLVTALLSVSSGSGQAQTYTITAIPAVQPGNWSANPFCVNDRGQVVGDGGIGPFLYDRANGTRLLPTLGGPGGGRALAINHIGQVVGYCNNLAGTSTAFLWDTSHGTRELDLVPDSNGVSAASLGWTFYRAVGINTAGDIACSGQFNDPTTGVATGADCIWRFTTDPTTGHASITVIQTPTLLNTLIDPQRVLNDRGAILGRATGPAGTTQSCLWDSNTGFFTWIDPAFGPNVALNSYGVATGYIKGAGALYVPGSGLLSLGSLGYGGTTPYDINDLGQVVGRAAGATKGSTLAFIWQNGAMKDLNALVITGGWKLLIADGISGPANLAGTAGYVIGGGTYKGQNTAFILTPK